MKNESKDKKFGIRLKKLRDKVRLYQHEVANKIGIHPRALQGHESGKMPSRRNLAKYVDFFKCSKDWLLTGQGPVYQDSDESTGAGAVVDETALEYKADKEDFGKAVSALKEIFDSGDPLLIPTTLAGLHAFQTSLRRKAYIQELKTEIIDIKKYCDSLKERITFLEIHLLEVDRRKQIRRQEDIGPPDGVERRSGSDRRTGIKHPFDSTVTPLKRQKAL